MNTDNDNATVLLPAYSNGAFQSCCFGKRAATQPAFDISDDALKPFSLHYNQLLIVDGRYMADVLGVLFNTVWIQRRNRASAERLGVYRVTTDTVEWLLPFEKTR